MAHSGIRSGSVGTTPSASLAHGLGANVGGSGGGSAAPGQGVRRTRTTDDEERPTTVS